MKTKLLRWMAALLTACMLMTVAGALSEALPEELDEAVSEMIEPEVLEEAATLAPDDVGEEIVELPEIEAVEPVEAAPYVYATTRNPGTWIYSDDALMDPVCTLAEGETVLVTGAWDNVAGVSFNTASGTVSGFTESGGLELLDAVEADNLLSDLAGSGSLSLYGDDINWPLFLADAELIEKSKDFTSLSNNTMYEVQGKSFCASMVGDYSDCWSWARQLYYMIWGTRFTTDWEGTDATGRNLIRNLTDEERLLTGENLRNFIGQSELGCTLRICSCPSTCPNFSRDGCSSHEKHSLMVMAKDAEGMVVMDNMTGSGDVKYTTRYYTWDKFASHWAKYKMIKYIKWPYAPEYVRPNSSGGIPCGGIRLNETSLTLMLGDTAQLTATVTPSNATNRTVTWRSSNPFVAYPDARGKIVAAGAGTATIIAETVNGLTAEALVKVTSADPDSVALNKSGTVTLGLGYTLQLTASFSPAKTSSVLTWKSSNPKVATVSETGLVTPIKTGTVTIGVATTNKKTDKVKVKVTGPSKVTLSKTGTLSLQAGSTLTLSAKVSPAEAWQGVEWASSNERIATVKDGVVTGVGQGTATIGVRTAVGNKTAKVKVKVTNPYEATSVTLDQSGTVKLAMGQTLSLNAKVAPANAITTLTWKSSNEKVARVSSDGVVTPVKAGSCTIGVATSNKKTDTVKIKVTAATGAVPKKVTLNRSGTVTLNVGETLSLSAAVTPADAVTALTWKSTDEKVAYISSSGVVTALRAGTATVGVITDNNKTATVKIKVKSAGTEAAKVTLNKSGTVTLKKGKTLKLKATLKPANATSAYTWKSTNPSVAMIDDNGVVYALRAGTATVGAITDNGKYATVKIKVTK